jgi:hypothetical protein
MPDLYFYDSTDPDIVKEARRTGDGDRNLILRGVTSFGSVLNVLDEFIQQQRRFGNVFFSTHGCPGNVDLPHGNLNISNAHQLRTRAGVFDGQGRVLFMGCNVGEDEVGWRFLEAIGCAFVQNGFVGASTSMVVSIRGGLIEPRMPKWGLLRIIQMRDGLVVRRTETGSLLAHVIQWIFD